jgi:POT family proton-dependent oligopeptide transporter
MSSPSSAEVETVVAAQRHPRGLSTLFLVEMWERFSYYGNRSLLILYMTSASERGGLGLDIPLAAAIYGLFTAAVFLTALPGGWIADRLIGARRALVVGGVFIMAGNLALILPHQSAFFFGLLLIAIGTGLLKPNASAMVGHLYPEGGYRRDAGFTIFYVGINLGAVLGPLVCATLGEKLSWQWGFIPAGFGMLCGLIHYKLSARHLGTIGLPPAELTLTAPGNRRPLLVLVAAGILFAAVAASLMTGLVQIDVIALARYSAYGIAAVAAIAIIGMLVFGRLDRGERQRFYVIIILMVCSVLFWAGFEQAGSSLTLFANDHTDRHLGTDSPEGGFTIPVGWFLALNPLFVILCAPLVSHLWMRLGKTGRDPSLTVKFAVSLALLGAGFLVMMAASSTRLAGDTLVSPMWLVTTYLLFTLGEVCLSPIGLSAITKLSPRRFGGQMLGLWFLATSLGNLVAGLMAGQFTAESVGDMPNIFLAMALVALAMTVVLLVLAKPISRLVESPRPLPE